MKCPLFMLGRQISIEARRDYKPDCLKEECAWWSEAEGNCSMLLMAAYLGGLVAIGDRLVDKMPHEEQFRR